MPEPKSAPKLRKIIDVTEPGKSAPPASSKPIIVTNRPMLKQDPMVVTAPADDAVTPAADGSATIRVAKSLSPLAGAASGQALAGKSKPVGIPIKTLVSAAAPANNAPTDTPVKSAELKDGAASMPPVAVTAAATKVEPPAASPAPAVPEPEAPHANDEPVVPAGPAGDHSETPADKPEAAAEPHASAVDSAASEAPAADSQLAPNQVVDEAKKKIDEQKAATLAEQEKIIASKKYYLPIKNASAGREDRQAWFLLLFVVLTAVVWLDVSLDAGIVTLGGLHAVTHFFH